MSLDKILWFYSESGDWQYLPIILGPLGNYAPVISNQQGVDENHKRPKHCIKENIQNLILSPKTKRIQDFLLESVEHFQSYIWWRNYLMIDQILENMSSLFPDINLVTISETSNED